MAEVTEQVINEFADGVEAVSDDFVAGLRMISARAGIATAALTALGGAVVGYMLAEKKLRTKYEQLAEEEIGAMREHFRARLVAKEVKPDLSDLGQKVQDLGYTGPPEDLAEKSHPAAAELTEEDPMETTLNVFEESSEWNQEAEDEARDPKVPYVICLDERHEEDHTEVTLTYYAEDDVLCDEKDKAIEDKEKVVGTENLDRFGHGSNDPNVVYIRNNELGVDIEVVRSEGSFAEEVHGMKHSESPRERPPRWDG